MLSISSAEEFLNLLGRSKCKSKPYEAGLKQDKKLSNMVVPIEGIFAYTGKGC